MKIELDEFVEVVCGRYGIPVEDAKRVDSFEELGLDSLTLYAVIGEVEQKFGFKFETNDITEINSISKMYSYISKLGSE